MHFVELSCYRRLRRPHIRGVLRSGKGGVRKGERSKHRYCSRGADTGQCAGGGGGKRAHTDFLSQFCGKLFLR